MMPWVKKATLVLFSRTTNGAIECYITPRDILRLDISRTRKKARSGRRVSLLRITTDTVIWS